MGRTKIVHAQSRSTGKGQARGLGEPRRAIPHAVGNLAPPTVKGIICFGVPLLLIIVCGVAGYLLGESWQVKPEMTAFAGMIAGGIIGCLVLKGYEKKINNNQTKAEITGIIS